MIRSRSVSKDLGESGARPSSRGILSGRAVCVSQRTDMRRRVRTEGRQDPVDAQLGSIRSMTRLLETQVPRRRDNLGVQ